MHATIRHYSGEGSKELIELLGHDPTCHDARQLCDGTRQRSRDAGGFSVCRLRHFVLVGQRCVEAVALRRRWSRPSCHAYVLSLQRAEI
jgi:hypothetical protein